MEQPNAGKESSDMVVLPEGRQKAELSSRYNDLYDARVSKDHQRLKLLEEQVAKQLEDFCATEGASHKNPQWICCVMRGGFLSARGDYKAALKPEIQGWEHANEPVQHWISAFNISDELRRSGSCDEALRWAEVSLKLNPSHSLSHLNLGLCLAAVGRLDEANDIFSKLIEMANFELESDGLASRLIYEREFDEFNNLPSVRTLKSRIASHGGRV